MGKIKSQTSAIKSSVYILKKSFRDYPKQSIAVITSIIISGFAESFSLLTFLPLLQIGIGKTALGSESQASLIEQFFIGFYDTINVEPTLLAMLITLVVLITLKSLSSLFTRAYIGIVSARVATDLRINLIKALLGTSWRHFVSQPTGRFANAISTEAQRASNAYLSAWNMIGAAIQIGFFMLASAVVSIEVLIFGILAGVVITSLLHWTVKLSRSAGTIETNLMNSLISRLTDNIGGIKPMKAMGLENKILPILIGDSKQLRSAQYKQAFSVSAQQNLAEPLMISMMAVGAYYAIEHTSITFAHMAIIALFFSRMVGRMSQLQKYYQMINSSESAYHSINSAINAALDLSPPRSGTLKDINLSNKISVKDLSFSYEDREIFKSLSLEIPANKLTALIGPSGCGKTTLVDIIIGLIAVNQGQVLIDETPLADIEYHSWQSKIGYVPQELYLFHDSIRNNITFKDDKYDDQDIWRALEKCGASDFVESLPDKLDTIIGERGSKISGGQRQRLMIARALVRNPSILILDEATTALDPQTEQDICRTIKDISHEITILAISHQPAVKNIADHVIDLTKKADKKSSAK